MKRFISILAILSFVMSFCVRTASAAMIGGAVQTRSDPASALDEQLRERLEQASDDEVIRVTVELMDSIDLDNIEMNAVSHANISVAEMLSLNAETFSLTDEDDESVQLAALKIYDRISKERNALLVDYYSVKNEAFISSTCLKDAEIGSVGMFTPFIRDVSLTKAEILELAADPEVFRIYIVEEHYLHDFDDDDNAETWTNQDINDTYRIVGGDAFVKAGYTGSGIRVGVVEEKRPILSEMGSDGNNITIDPDSVKITGDHPTMVCGIIKKFAPSCSIYTYALGEKPTEYDTVVACSYLINKYTLHVLNLSFGKCGNKKYTEHAREMDSIIRNTKVPIVVASGNADTSETGTTIYSTNVNVLGISGNAITVGAVASNGTDPDAPEAYVQMQKNCNEEETPIDKPDLCAPGNLIVYGYKKSGTSFAAPHVTGTVVQMMARNPAFVNQPQKLKAALIASATRHYDNKLAYISGTIITDVEGAGILDSEFCYRLAKAGRSTHFDATSSSNTFSHNVYCDYTTKPFRVACTWEVADSSSNYYINVSDFDMKVYKNGNEVASSTAITGPTQTSGTNSELIEIPTDKLKEHGGGYYTVEIYLKGNTGFHGTGTVRIGLAWEQD